jgi:hypothetical protein
MKCAAIFSPILFIFSALHVSFAQTDTAVATNPAPGKIDLFAPTQYDSILALVPGGDTLRAKTNIMSIGTDQSSGDIVIIFLDASGAPVKSSYPTSNLKAPSQSPSPAPSPSPSPSLSPSPSTAKPVKPDQNGRTWFIIESAIKSGFIYPMSFANAFEGANSQSVAGFSLLMVGGTLYGTFAFTKNMDLGYGKTGIMNYSTTLLGNYYPALINAFLTGTTDLDIPPTKTVNDPYYSYTYTEEGVPTTEKINAWCSMIGFPLGMVIGSKLNLVEKDDFGRVALMEWFSQSFGGMGFVLPIFFMDPSENGDAYLTVSSLLSMAALPTGLAFGKSIGGVNKPISAGRGVLPGISGTLGMLTGIAFAALPDYDDLDGIAIARITAGLGVAGWGGGTWLGLNYHPSIDYTFWQSVFIGLSSGAGTLMGVALPLIAQADSRQPYIIAGVAGGWTGFFVGEKLSLSLFEKSSRDRSASALQLNLPGLAALPVILTNADNRRQKSASRASNAILLPMANLEWRF